MFCLEIKSVFFQLGFFVFVTSSSFVLGFALITVSDCNYFHLLEWVLLSLRRGWSSWAARSSSRSSSKLPRASGDGTLFQRVLEENGHEPKALDWPKYPNCMPPYSGTPSGGSTTERMLSISLYLRMRSLTVVDVREGLAFTCGQYNCWWAVLIVRHVRHANGRHIVFQPFGPLRKTFTSMSQGFSLLSIMMS